MEFHDLLASDSPLVGLLSSAVTATTALFLYLKARRESKKSEILIDENRTQIETNTSEIIKVYILLRETQQELADAKRLIYQLREERNTMREESRRDKQEIAQLKTTNANQERRILELENEFISLTKEIAASKK